MPPEVFTSLDHYCPDHWGHILTRSGYCIHGQHRPEPVDTKAARKADVIKEPAMHLVHKEAESEPVTTDLDIAVADAMIRRQTESEPGPEGIRTTPDTVTTPLRFGTIGAARADLDPATGEIHEPTQMSLSDEIMSRYEEPHTALSVGGTAKLLMNEWAVMGASLECEDRVAVTCLCTVAQLATDGKSLIVKLHLETISGMQVMPSA